MSMPDDQSNLFSFMADFGVKLGHAANAMDRAARIQARAASLRLPSNYRLMESKALDANGNGLFFDHRDSGPDSGFSWNVRSITVAGPTPTTATAGRADVYVSAAAVGIGLTTPLANLGAADWRDYAPSLPSVAFYGSGELSLQCPEELLIVITGGSAGEIVTVGVGVENFQVGIVGQEWDR